MALPPVLPVSEIHRRLQRIFPEGTPNRNYCVREIAAKTVFVMLYAAAISSRDAWIRPDQVTRMTDAQAARADEAARVVWARESLKSQKGEIRGRWYAVNTREPIRDETLREGLIPTGAVEERQGLPTTSSKPRYALRPEFAALFDPKLKGKILEAAIADWQGANLSAGALARIAVMRKGAVAAESGIMVTFPNGETRRMAPGPSSVISKAVVEEFAPRYLDRPGVIFLSESRDRVVARDEDLARAIGLEIRAEKNLPDILLVDLGPTAPLLVFIEVVATDGPVSESRKKALLQLATDAGFDWRQVAFVTAYLDRSQGAFKKTVDSLAWNSFAWFAAEPDGIVSLMQRPGENGLKLSALLSGT